MFTLRPVAYNLGLLLAILALAMAIPALVDAVHNDPDWLVFAAAAVVTLFFGLLLGLIVTALGGVCGAHATVRARARLARVKTI